MPSTWSPTPSRFCVLLSEELGYASWYWYPGLTPAHLERWFRGAVLPTDQGGAPFFAKDLPGRRARVQDQALFEAQWVSGTWWIAHAHVHDDSWLCAPDGRAIRPILSTPA